MTTPKDESSFEDYYLCFEREYRNSVAPIDTPDEKKYFKMFWQAASAASRTATLKELLEALPEKRRTPFTAGIAEVTAHWNDGWNMCHAEIRAIIEKKLDSV